MPLKYSLIANPMTSDPDDCIAVTHQNRALTLKDLADKIVSRGSTVTHAEILAVFEELCLAVENVVKEGRAVNTPLFKISQSIKGRFTNDNDRFDANRHHVRLKLHAGVRLRQAIQAIDIQKIPATKQQPVPLHFHDFTSETDDLAITPGGMGRITGMSLKLDEGNAACGVFLVHTATGTRVRIEQKLLRNKPSELIFKLPPALPAGSYRLEVLTIFKGNKVVRTGTLPEVLSVAV